MESIHEIIISLIYVFTGLYFFGNGWKIVILKQRILIFPIRLGIWINGKFNGPIAASKQESKETSNRILLLNGVSYLLIGIFFLAVGVLALFPYLSK